MHRGSLSVTLSKAGTRYGPSLLLGQVNLGILRGLLPELVIKIHAARSVMGLVGAMMVAVKPWIVG